MWKLRLHIEIYSRMFLNVIVRTTKKKTVKGFTAMNQLSGMIFTAPTQPSSVVLGISLVTGLLHGHVPVEVLHLSPKGFFSMDLRSSSFREGGIVGVNDSLGSLFRWIGSSGIQSSSTTLLHNYPFLPFCQHRNWEKNNTSTSPNICC